MGITVQVDNAPLLVSSHLDVTGPVLNDTVVQKQGSLHVHGNLIGSLTIEMGASVIVEGYVDGKIINRGGRLVVNNNVLVDLTKIGGPPEAESGGVLKINLSAIALNWSALARRTVAECAAVIRADAYGCGIDIVASALTRSGCKTFFVSNLAEAKCVRAVHQTQPSTFLTDYILVLDLRLRKSMCSPSYAALLKWRNGTVSSPPVGGRVVSPWK